jgi:AcrR family transcriptional regulator
MEPTRVRRPRSRRGEGEQLRDDIVDAASEVLGAHGDVNALTLRAVARAVGVATTSIYLHFQTLDQLVDAVRGRFFDEFGAALATARAAAGPDPRRQLHAGMRAYVDYGLRHPGRYRTMFEVAAGLPDWPGNKAGLEVFGRLRAAVMPVAQDSETAAMQSTHLWTALHGIVTLRSAIRQFEWIDLQEELDDLFDRIVPPAGDSPR